MRFSLLVVLFVLSMFATSVYGQSNDIQSIHVTAGTILTFYSQTRLNPSAGNVLDALPSGTVLKVKMLDSINSSADRDGRGFRGVLVSALTSNNEVLVRPDAEVHGLLVLLRSRNHPEGFRHELLITSITENGKSYDLTASLNPSFFEGVGKSTSGSNSTTPQTAKDPQASIAKLPVSKN